MYTTFKPSRTTISVNTRRCPPLRYCLRPSTRQSKRLRASGPPPLLRSEVTSQSRSKQPTEKHSSLRSSRRVPGMRRGSRTSSVNTGRSGWFASWTLVCHETHRVACLPADMHCRSHQNYSLLDRDVFGGRVGKRRASGGEYAIAGLRARTPLLSMLLKNGAVHDDVHISVKYKLAGYSRTHARPVRKPLQNGISGGVGLSSQAGYDGLQQANQDAQFARPTMQTNKGLLTKGNAYAPAIDAQTAARCADPSQDGRTLAPEQHAVAEASPQLPMDGHPKSLLSSTDDLSVSVRKNSRSLHRRCRSFSDISTVKRSEHLPFRARPVFSHTTSGPVPQVSTPKKEVAKASKSI